MKKPPTLSNGHMKRHKHAVLLPCDEFHTYRLTLGEPDERVKKVYYLLCSVFLEPYDTIYKNRCAIHQEHSRVRSLDMPPSPDL